MRHTVLFLAFAVWAMLPATAQQPEFRRLDGSKITSSFVDMNLARLMTGAEVPGVSPWIPQRWTSTLVGTPYPRALP
jgi:hypothetical protein